MRCFICNSILKPEDVKYNRKYEDDKHGPFEPCPKCLIAIADVFNDHEDDYDESGNIVMGIHPDDVDSTLLDEDYEESYP